ncbi:MAG: alpha amylase N-terminal ig-like domain-containing protein, partial [Clostridiales bacterium]|nr:alpha amylase N-terminal ig-like domain-containing protein [Clostridiales bacterium]
MNKHALYHKSDSHYSFALTPDTVELRLRAAKDDIRAVKLIYGKKHEFCMRQSSASMSFAASDGLYDYFTVRLKLKDKRLAYVFYIESTDGKSYYYSEDGATENYDFSNAFYNFFQLAYINENDVMNKVDWLSQAVVYQIFVDRFYRGDGEEKSDDGYINLKWGQKPTPKSFAGGTLWGV